MLLWWRRKKKPDDTPDEAGADALRDDSSVNAAATKNEVAEPSPPLTAATLRYDVHNHLLPGVDDGAQTFDESCECLKLLIDQGYQGAVVTPHIHQSQFPNDESMLRDRFDEFTSRVANELPAAADFKLSLGAEYMMDGAFLDKLYGSSARDALIRFGPDSSHILIEFQLAVLPANMDDLLAECQRQNLRPVLAHVERYDFVVASSAGHDRLRQWRDAGAMAQINIGSLVGQYGKTIMRAARTLWQENLVDLLGTDMHRTDRARTALPDAWAFLASQATAFDPTIQQGLIASPT